MGLLGLAAHKIPGRAAQMEEDRISLLRVVAEAAIAGASRFEAEEQAGRMDRTAAQAAAPEAIRATRHGGQEYLWVNDTQARTRMVAHPFRRDLEEGRAGGSATRPASPCSAPSPRRRAGPARAWSATSSSGPAAGLARRLSRSRPICRGC
jgi:hypothetical protein